ncbi:acyl-CoA thioesterase [Deinococcus yavapaiensis]|nr:thioesterase family protein [Deinococcus yavapaiensis]
MPPFRFLMRVRYSECDAQKIVFNARYGEYVDISTTEFFRALGLGEAQASGELDYRLVKQTTEWRASAKFDDVLDLATETTRLGTTSFTLTTTFRRFGDEAVLATTETVYVLTDKDTHRPIPLPDELRSSLHEGARGKLTNHAGASV